MSKVIRLSTQENVVQGSFREGTFQRIIRQIREWNDNRRAIRQLSMMSDKLLNDIGIERYQIRDAVKNKAAFARIDFNSAKSSEKLTAVKQAA